MELRTVTLKLSPEMLRASARIASEQDVTVGQLVRDLLGTEIRKRQRARPPIRAEEQLVAPFRARLAKYLSTCETWEDLQAQLKCQGYHLKEAGGGHALYSHPEDQRICKASELGYSYGRLLERIGTPFPGHSHTWVADKIKGQANARPSEIT